VANNYPNFPNTGGTVFGWLAAQWQQFFGSKVDAEGGTADNLTMTGTVNATNATIIGLGGTVFTDLTVNNSGVAAPVAPSGTLVQAVGIAGSITRYVADAVGQPGVMTFRRADGTNALPANLVGGDEIGSVNAWGCTGSVGGTGSYTQAVAAVRFFASGTLSWAGGTSTPGEIRLATVGLASGTLTDRWVVGGTGGLYGYGVSGSDVGSGAVNASAYYINGIPALTGAVTLTGDVTGSGTSVIATTLATVNGSVGTFQGITVNAKGLVTAATAQNYFTSLVGDARNLIANLAAGTTSVTFAADQVVVASALNGTGYLLASYNQTFNGTTTGAGGMDTGALPTSGFVAIYAIYNPTVPATSILGTNGSGASPTIYAGGHMPAGYTASALLGIWPTGSVATMLAGYVSGRQISFAARSALSTNSNVNTNTSLSLTSLVPLAARTVSGYAQATLGTTPTVNGAPYCQVGSDSNLIGQQQVFFAIVTLTTETGVFSGSFSNLAMPTPQTIYYQISSSGTTPTNVIFVNGYGW
jgi:hypothetical protein